MPYDKCVAPMGLTNSPATFNRITQGLFGKASAHAEYTEVFVDDLGVHTETWAEHLTALRAVLTELRKQSLYINFGKSVLAARSVKFLGEQVSAAGRAPDPARVEAMATWPMPTSFESVRTFLGHTGYL